MQLVATEEFTIEQIKLLNDLKIKKNMFLIEFITSMAFSLNTNSREFLCIVSDFYVSLRIIFIKSLRYMNIFSYLLLVFHKRKII